MPTTYVEYADKLVCQGRTIPKDPGNRDYRKFLALAAQGQADIVPGVVSTIRSVPKIVVVERLHAAGKLAAARTAIDAASLLMREKWNAAQSIKQDDPDALALLTAIGADPAVILA